MLQGILIILMVLIILLALFLLNINSTHVKEQSSQYKKTYSEVENQQSELKDEQ